MHHLFIITVFLLSLNACATELTSEKYQSDLTESEIARVLESVPQPASGMAQLCILNPLLNTTGTKSPCFETFSGSSSYIWSKNIILDGESITNLQTGEYYCKNIEVGQHILNANKTDNRKKVDIDTSYNFIINPDEVLFLEEHYNEYRPLQSKNINHIVKKLCITETEQKSYCEDDDYKKTKFCYSPTYEYNDDAYGKTNTYFGINAKFKLSEPYIIVTYTASDWAFIKSATDDSGADLNITQIKTNVSRAIYETYRIDLTMNYIQQHQNTGINIKLYGRNRNSYIKLPPEYIQGWLKFLKNNM